MDANRQRIVLSMDIILELMEAAFVQGGSYDLAVTGFSMSPTLLPGRDQVRLIDARRCTLKKGDILFARRRVGGYMLHRIVRIFPDGSCDLNGDGQVWLERVDAKDIIGFVTHIQRKGKWISVKNPVYCTYVFLWRFTRPMREWLVRVKQKLTGKGRRQ